MESERPQLLQVVKIWGRINHAFYFFLRLSHVRSYRTQEFCGIALCSFRAKMATCAHLASPPNQSHAPKLKHLNPYNHQSKPKESADVENSEISLFERFFLIPLHSRPRIDGRQLWTPEMQKDGLSTSATVSRLLARHPVALRSNQTFEPLR